MITAIDYFSFKCVRMGLGMHFSYSASLAYMNPGFDPSAVYRTGCGGTAFSQNLRDSDRKSRSSRLPLAARKFEASLEYV